MLKKHLGVRPDDIARPINIPEWVKYVTKQDQNAILINIPLKFASTTYKARIYSDQGANRVVWSDFVPSQIASCDRKIFEDLVLSERKLKENELLRDRSEKVLRPWQEELLQIISDENTNRTVFWVHDQVGGCGKSVLAHQSSVTTTERYSLTSITRITPLSTRRRQ